jgi:hypothetical protein
MFRWFISAAVLLLLYNVSAFAQGATVWWYYLPENGTALTTVCQGGVGIPDGSNIWVMWDANNNGPDVADQPAILCGSPTCDGCPGGTSLINHFPFNGVASGFGAGYFAMFDFAFSTCGALQTPSKFYLRVYDTDGVTPLWTSVVYTLVAGPQEVFIPQSDWTCGAGGPQCVVLDAQE